MISSEPEALESAVPSGRTAVVVLVCAVMVAMLALPVRSWFLQRARIAAAEDELAATEDRIAALTEANRNWYERAYVVDAARLRLNYVFPGEVGVVVLGDQEPAQLPKPQTWYEGLWQTVEAASGRGETVAGEPIQVRPSAPR